MDHSEREGLCTSCLDVSGALVTPAGSSPDSPSRSELTVGFNRLQTEDQGEAQAGDGISNWIFQLRDALECEAIGIRLVDDDGYLIYRAHLGFPSGFCDYVSGICVPDERCLCVQVLRSNLDSASGCRTDRGSLVTSSLADLRSVASSDPDRVPHLTGVDLCYQSVAVTPLRCMGHNLGIIHSAADQTDHFTPERVRILEETAQGIALDLFYDSLWRPAYGLGESGYPVRAQAICPICSRRRNADDTWKVRDASPTDLAWTVLGAPRLMCPTCLRFCNSE